MALTGDLKDFGLLQLLTLIQVTGKTGSLTLERAGETAIVYFEDGRLTKAKALSSKQDGLASALYQAGIIDKEQYDQISSQPPPSEKALGLLLVDQGGLTQEEIVDFVRTRSLAELNNLLTWPDGTFRLEVGVSPPDDEILAPTELAPVIEKARRYLDEWQLLTSYIPDLERPLRLLMEPRQQTQEIALGLPEWRMVVSLAQEISLAEVARRLGLDQFAVRQVAYRLIKAGLAEVAEPAVVQPAPSPYAGDTPQPKVGPLSRLFGQRRK